MSEEEKLLRTSLLPGLLRAARHNLARRSRGVALFEVAATYVSGDGPLPHEPLMLGGVFSGTRQEQTWNAPVLEWDFFGVKGVVTELFDSMRIAPLDFSHDNAMPFHPSRTARLSWGNTIIGKLGQLHPEVCRTFDVPEATVGLEIALDPVFAALPARASAGDVPRFPSVLLDLAVVVDVAVESAAIEKVIRDAGQPELVSLRLFDVYSGPQVPDGQKSLAYALQLQASDRTLTEEDAVRVSDRILETLEDRFGAKLRT